jgi:hypothetical protein
MHGGIVNEETIEKNEDVENNINSRQRKFEEYFYSSIIIEKGDGFKIQFLIDKENITEFIKFITDKRESYPSLEFDTILAPNEKPLEIDIKGPEVKKFVKELISK